MVIAAIQITAHSSQEPGEEIAECYGMVLELQRAAQASGYQVEKLMAEVRR